MNSVVVESGQARRARFSHEGDLAAPHVPVTDAEAVDIALSQFGVRGTVVRFATEKDDTFRLDGLDGRQYVLKIANPSEPALEIDFQTCLLRHVARVAPGLPVPRVFAGVDGADLPMVKTVSGARRFVRLMSFMPGVPLDRASSNGAQRESIGELLARLRLATASFAHLADGRLLAWDVRHLSSLAGLLSHVQDEGHRRALSLALERFASIESQLARCRTQVLHNDFNTSNIVVSRDDPALVSGIIDFGDAVRTAIAVDVSTALMNQLPRRSDVANEPDLFHDARDVLRGYLRVADLTEDELRLVPHLAMGRVVTRALLTTWRAELFPDNRAYILRNTLHGWGHLDWFLRRSTDEISDLLMPGGSNPSRLHKDFS